MSVLDADIVRKLISGSSELDRMWEEIQAVPKMLLGFIRPVELQRWWPKGIEYSRTERCLRMPSARFTWTLVSGCEGRKPQLFLERNPVGGALGLEWRLLTVPSPKKNRDRGLRSSEIKDVHESLTVLVHGMVEALPDIQEYWRPLLDAAK